MAASSLGSSTCQSGYAVFSTAPSSSATRVVIELKDRSTADRKASMEHKIGRLIDLVASDTETIQSLVAVLVSKSCGLCDLHFP